MEGAAELGFAITLDDAAAPFPMTLRLIPRVLESGDRMPPRRDGGGHRRSGGEVLCSPAFIEGGQAGMYH